MRLLTAAFGQSEERVLSDTIRGKKYRADEEDAPPYVQLIEISPKSRCWDFQRWIRLSDLSGQQGEHRKVVQCLWAARRSTSRTSPSAWFAPRWQAPRGKTLRPSQRQVVQDIHMAGREIPGYSLIRPRQKRVRDAESARKFALVAGKQASPFSAFTSGCVIRDARQNLIPDDRAIEQNMGGTTFHRLTKALRRHSTIRLSAMKSFLSSTRSH